MDDLIPTWWESPCLLKPGIKGRPKRGQQHLYRLLWIEKNGPVPDGYELDHLCKEPLCYNPDHLEPVRHSVNMQRGRGAKIDQATAEKIRAETGTLREIASRYGLHHTTVLAIRKSHAGRLQAWT